MRKLFGWNIVSGLLFAACTWSAGAAVVYDNSSNDLTTRFNPGTAEVGDEIVLGGSDRSVTNFTFEWWGTSALLSGFTTVDVKVTFYANDGVEFNGVASPGTVLWESSWYNLLGPTPRNTLVYKAGVDMPADGVLVPSDFTWTVQFRGLGAGDSAGVDLYSPPTVGQNYPDYWQNTESGWVLLTNSVPMDFAAKFEATTVPEPTTLTLSILGGFGLLVVSRWLRRS